jgi:PAS domain S-box-containing protein
MPGKPKTPFINRILSKRDKLESSVVADLLLEVAQERDLLEVIFESMIEGVIAADRERKIVFFNTAAATVFGFRDEPVLGRALEEALPEGPVREAVLAGIESGERLYDAEVRLEAPVERLLNINLIPLTDRLERFFGTLIMVIDVTEKRAGEARLSLAEKLASRTTISAGIAHEIRNPLNSLSIHLQLAEKQWNGIKHTLERLHQTEPEALPRPGMEKLEGNLRVIRDEVERLDRVVKNFLLAVRPQQPNWSFVDIERAVTGALQVLEPEIGQHAISLVLEPLEEPLTVPMDEFQIRQALINLIRNAIDAQPAGGAIRVRLTKLPDRVRIQILDSGEGISKENLNRIFEPYYTTRAQGTGLGLAVVERIVREHRGRIRIESEPGKGTCVTVDLPLSADTAKQIPILDEGGEEADSF